jgi:hypothetical protein
MKFVIAIVTASIIAASATSALAGSYDGTCTTEPQKNWIKIEMIEMKAKEACYSVSKSKISGSCYEVYATKDSKRFELFYNPMSADIVHTVAK